MFKALVFQRKSLLSGAIANLDIVKASISEDLTQKATSSLTCLSIPTNVSQYDLIRVYDTKGRFNYWGVINSIADNVIKCSQFQSMFNDNLLEVKADTDEQIAIYTESRICDLMAGYIGLRTYGFISNKMEDGVPVSLQDYDVAQSYQGITATIVDVGTERYPYPTENKVRNIEQVLYEMFKTYNRIIIPNWVSKEVDVLYTETNHHLTTEEGEYFSVFKHVPVGQQHIDILICNPTGIIELSDGKKLDFTQKTLFDTYENISNLSIVKEEEDTNTVHVFNKDGSQYRGGYTIKNDGTIVQIGYYTEILNRLGVNKTKYIFDSDNEVLDLVKNELPSLQYNHKITFDISFDDRNKFEDYRLAQPIRFFENANNRLFNTMLTAWKYEIEENSDVIKKASFTLGKTRTTLTSKLLKQ